MACPKCGCKETYQHNDSDEEFGTDAEDMQICSACGSVFYLEDELPEDD